jgi:hypothetical protein
VTTEQEFLRLQAQRAKERLAEELRGLGRDLVDPLDPRPSVRRRPFTGVAISLAAGLLAGLGLGSVRWERLKRWPKRRAAAAPRDGEQQSKTASWAKLLRRAQSLVKVALTTAAFVRGRTSGTEAAPTAVDAHADGVPSA